MNMMLEPKPLQVLLVEDSEDDAALIARELSRGGFVPAVTRVETRTQMERALARQSWDVVIADYVLPSFDGMQALLLLREQGLSVPFILVSGMIGEGLAVEVMKAGAQDYVMKGNLARLAPAVGRELGEANLRRQLRLHGAAMAAAANAIMITDQEGRIEWVNEAFTRMCGYSEEELIGRSVRLIKSGIQDPSLYKEMWKTILAGKVWRWEIVNRRKDGSLYNVEQTITPLLDEHGRIANFISIHVDIGERLEAHMRLHQLTNFDALTSLPNRRLFVSRLQQAVVHADRSGLNAALLMLDLDRFKFINDTLGHRAGDVLIQGVAERLLEVVRAGDMLSRLGGDEFAMIMNEVVSLEDPVLVAQRITAALAAPFVLDGHEVYVSTSIGIALYPNDAECAEDLARNADAAMFRAKEAGGNGYRFYMADLNARAAHRLALESSLRHALERDEFELYYQPQIDLTSGNVVGMEALLRWRHPERGLVPPTAFIPIAEETGLIVPIGEWVLGEACRQNREWQRQGLMPMRIAVNLSARQFDRDGLLPAVEGALGRSGLSPACLELEITEGVVMTHPEASIATLKSFNAMGISIAIDDFGTGYSSLNYLKRFPIHTLKIDQSFVRDVTADQDDAAIVTAIIAMAHSLELKVIAEGVETQAQLEFLRQGRCNEVQGYFYGRPMPAEDARVFLSSRSAVYATGSGL